MNEGTPVPTRLRVERAIGALRRAGIDAPEREGYLILALALETTVEALWREPSLFLSLDEARKFEALIGRRQAGEPFAYLSRSREFFGLSLFTPPGVLIPRPETEHLVETVLAETDLPNAPLVVDVGCGSGAIALAVRSARPRWRILATDIQCWPLLVTMVNSARLSLPLAVLRADLLDWGPWTPGIEPWALEPIDILCANLPYIGVEEVHGMSVETQFEPPEALFAADAGLFLLDALIDSAPRRLAANGGLFLEVGARQAAVVVERMRRRGFSQVKTVRDLSGVQRVVYGRWRRGA